MPDFQHDLLITNQNSNLRVYPTFAEVEQHIKVNSTEVKILFSRADWEHIVVNSLELRGPIVLAMSRRAVAPLTYLEGQTLSVRLVKDQPPVPVKLVRASDLLVTGPDGYQFIDIDQIVFDILPKAAHEQPVQEVKFQLKNTTESTLSYLTQGLYWQVRYSLEVDKESDEAALTGLADIHNKTKKSFEPAELELLAGEVPYQFDHSEENVSLVMYSAPSSRMDFSSESAEEMGELAGLYRYKIEPAPALPPLGTYTTALQETTVKLQRFARLSNHFQSYAQRVGQLQRCYKLVSEERLLNGKLNVREDHRLVGQTEIEETPAGQSISFSLGFDPDLSYFRTVKILDRQHSADQKITVTQYQVTYEVENAKNRHIDIEIRETFYRELIDVQEANLIDKTIHIDGKLAAGESVKYTYKVTMGQ